MDAFFLHLKRSTAPLCSASSKPRHRSHQCYLYVEMTHRAAASWESVLPPSAKKKESFQNKIKAAVLPNIIQSLKVGTGKRNRSWFVNGTSSKGLKKLNFETRVKMSPIKAGSCWCHTQMNLSGSFIPQISMFSIPPIPLKHLPAPHRNPTTFATLVISAERSPLCVPGELCPAVGFTA